MEITVSDVKRSTVKITVDSKVFLVGFHNKIGKKEIRWIRVSGNPDRYYDVDDLSNPFYKLSPLFAYICDLMFEED
jgi:hypothetical protein